MKKSRARKYALRSAYLNQPDAVGALGRWRLVGAADHLEHRLRVLVFDHRRTLVERHRLALFDAEVMAARNADDSDREIGIDAGRFVGLQMQRQQAAEQTGEPFRMFGGKKF